MPNSSYNRDDIPRELQRLIAHTDRGIEQLYELAGKSRASPPRGETRRQQHRQSNTEAQLSRRSRDAYYYDAAHEAAPVGDTHAGPSSASRPYHRHSDRDRSRQDTAREEDSFLELDERSDGESSASGTLHVDGYAQHSRSSHRMTKPRTSALDDHSKAERSHRMRIGGRVSPNSTPYRTPDRAAATTASARAASPASLTKPRYTHPPHLPSPPSFLSTSSPHHHHATYATYSTSASPPWRERQWTFLDEEDRAAVAAGVEGSRSHHASTAYYSHVAAQQSTQKPDPTSRAAAAARRRRHRARLYSDEETEQEEREEEETPSCDTSPPPPPPRDRHHRATPPADLTGSDNHDSSSFARHNGPRQSHPHNTSSASATMLSRFGKRWGTVFQDMLVDPPAPPSPPPPAASRSSSSRPAAASAKARKEAPARRPRTQPPPASSSATSTASEAHGEGGTSSMPPPHQVSASFHAAAAAIAARHRPSPQSSAVPSPNRSGLNTSGGAAATAALVGQPLVNLPQSGHTSFEYNTAADARLAEQLRRELKAKEDAMLQLRMDHAREVAEVRQSLALERASATKHTADELAATYHIQQQLLQSSLQTERERVVEAEEQLRLTRREAAQRKLDLEDATHALAALQHRYDELQQAQQRLAEQSARWKAQAEQGAAMTSQLQSHEKVWRAKEVDWQAREADLQRQREAVEARLEEHEAAAQTTLAQVEAEFTQASQSYQDLLAEATKRMSYLEKSHRKYKLLKESHALLKSEHAQLVEATVQRTGQHESEVAAMRAEVQELRQQLHRRDAATEEAEASQQEMLADYKRRLELQEANAAAHAKTLQQHIDTANHTIELLRSQLEGAKQEALEEQARHQQSHMEAAQAELRAKEVLSEQQRSAAAYKVRSEDIIAQQKRQLRERDAKLQALAASSAEPVQRLRQQLDDERGRRARLEEQLKRLKLKAKEAEEQAAAELRREQLRTALLLTPTAAQAVTASNSSFHPHQRHTRSATATPSSKDDGATTPRPAFMGVGEGGGVRGDAALRTASSATSSAAGRGGGSASVGVRSSPLSRRLPSSSPSPAAAAVVVGRGVPVDATAAARRAGTTRSDSPSQTTADDARTGARWQAGDHEPAVQRQFQSPSEASTTQPLDTATRHSEATPSTTTRASRPPAHDTPQEPPPVQPHKSAATIAAATSPNATVQSLSGISQSSLYTSAVVGEVELEEIQATAAATTAVPRRHPRDVESDSEDEKDRAARQYVRRLQRSQPESEKRGEEGETERRSVRSHRAVMSPPPPSASAASVPRDDNDGAIAEAIMDPGLQAHEQSMRTFHASALEVMRRFAASRHEALAQCADIVKQTAQERLRDAENRRRPQRDAEPQTRPVGNLDDRGGATDSTTESSDAELV